jgi:hypothetical protein
MKAAGHTRGRSFVFASAVLLALAGLAQQGFAETWRPWETVKGTSISWRYRWDAGWSDYNIQIRTSSDQAVTVKFILSCGKEKSVGYWTLKPGVAGDFIQDFSRGGPTVPLRLEIVEQTS